MPRNGPMMISFLYEMMHYFKIYVTSTCFSQNECSELVRGPFNIQISVNIDFKTQTTENKQVFLTPARFWDCFRTPPWEEICTVSKDQKIMQKRNILYCEDISRWKTSVMKIVHCEEMTLLKLCAVINTYCEENDLCALWKYCTVKNSIVRKFRFVINVHCEKRNYTVKGHASNTPVHAKGTVADFRIGFSKVQKHIICPNPSKALAIVWLKLPYSFEDPCPCKGSWWLFGLPW